MDDELIIVKAEYKIGETIVELDVPMIWDYPLGADPRVFIP